MRARLLCRSGPLEGKDFEITGKLTIGRSSGNSVVLPSRLISGAHAQIVFDGDREQYYLEDLGSLNGTEVDGIPVDGRERLDRLHVITFGRAFDFIWQGRELCAELPPLASPTAPTDTTLETAVGELPPTLEDLEGPLAEEVVERGTLSDADAISLPPNLSPPGPQEAQSEGPDPGSTRTDQEAVTVPPALAERPAGSRGFVLVMTLDQRIQRARLQPGENLVGRSPGAEVFIDNTEISRRHAVLTVSGSKVRLRDEGSRNQTFVNGEPVEGEVEVAPGTQLRFGVVEAFLMERE